MTEQEKVGLVVGAGDQCSMPCLHRAEVTFYQVPTSVNEFEMPFIELQSNLAASCFSEDFLKKLSSCAAAALQKPENVSTE